MNNLVTGSISREVAGYFTKSMRRELADLIDRQDKLRVSGFPFCGLKKAYEKMTFVPTAIPSDAGREFYTSVGTAAHLVFQRWLGQGGRIWGDWKCYNKQCNHIVHFSKKRKCPKCKSEMEYEEFEVKAYRHLSGHIDGVYQSTNGSFWVIDYKTSSVKNIKQHRKFGDLFPYAKNKAQIMTYCALLEEKYDIKISGWSLLYIARDDPYTIEVCSGVTPEKAKKSILRKCKQYDEQWEVIQNLRTPADIEYLVETKPCKTREFYNEHFKGFHGCPLEAVCFTRSIKSFATETLKDYRKELKLLKSK